MYNVLLVDDEKLDLEGMRAFIPWEELGLNVVGAVNNGFEACQVLKDFSVDILVTDVSMPNMSGLELAKKALEIHPNIRIIFVSGYRDFNYVKQAMSLNARDYVLKPMDDQELIETLRKVAQGLDQRMIPFVKNELMNLDQMAGMDEQLDELFSAMSNYALVPLIDAVDQLFTLAKSMPSQLSIHNFLMYFILKLDAYLSNHHPDFIRKDRFDFARMDFLQQAETFDEIRSWLVRSVFEISEQIHFKKRRKNWKLIQEINQYVEEHLHENITLKDVSDHVAFSPNYLGHLFKQETGTNFSEYVISRRMERAAELLKGSKLKIYEIAEKVGYKYLPYFSKQFKETYGMTPFEYKRKS